jgi:hypothetical protein
MAGTRMSAIITRCRWSRSIREFQFADPVLDADKTQEREGSRCGGREMTESGSDPRNDRVPGMNCAIERRDFLGGVLIGEGDARAESDDAPQDRPGARQRGNL